MQEIIPFEFKKKKVRLVKVNEEPWFVAKDVSSILGYRDATNLARRLDSDEKGTQKVSTPSGKQEMTIVNESGLYSAILYSNKPEAKAFKRWITHEVLPTIRKTGGYISPKANDAQIAALLDSFREEAYHRAQAEAENKQLRSQIDQLAAHAVPENFGKPSEFTGLPRDIIIRCHARSDRKPHQPQNERYIQLLLPLYSHFTIETN